MIKRRCMVAILCILAVALFGCATGKSVRGESSLNQLGVAEYGKGNYRNAAEYYRKALEHTPNDAVIWSNLGDAYSELKDYSGAAMAYTKSLDLRPGSERVLHWRGWAYFHTREYNKAIVDFDKVIMSEKYRPRALRGRGLSYHRKGMYKNAFTDFNAAVQIDPRDGDALLGRAWVNYYTGAFKEAVKDFTRALEEIGTLRKDLVRDALYGKALAYIGVGDGESATLLAEKARATADLANWPLLMVYYLSGNKQKAWQLRGGEGAIGLKMSDYEKGQIVGVEVKGAQEGSPAASAGFIEGDVVVAVNTTPIKRTIDCTRAVMALKPGTLAEITFLREQRERKIRVRVGSAEMLIFADPLAVPLVSYKKVMSEGGEVMAGQVQSPPDHTTRNNPPAEGGDEFF